MYRHANCSQQFAFFAEKWVPVFFDRRPWTAHHHQAAHVIHSGNLIFTVEPSNIDFASALFRLAGNDSSPSHSTCCKTTQRVFIFVILTYPLYIHSSQSPGARSFSACNCSRR
jgi:hypothetical protein